MDTKRSFTDQMGARVTINFPPKRIISLVPSQTELLADLGLDEKVIAITKYCTHPVAWQKSKQIVGGTKNFDVKMISDLNPDIIIGNKEENFKDGILQLSRYPVWMSDIATLEEAISMITSIGEMTDRGTQAASIVQDIRRSFSGIKKFSPATVLYMIWRKPWMAAGRGTFINSMLETLGLKNAIETARYPQLTESELQTANPQYIFLSSEPYPFQEKHIEEIRTLCPMSEILLVNGEMFSWYGSRLIQAPEYFGSMPIS
jgi:ABC-type Fe3+-hydroxamate transport system substrate-binding protein